MIQPLKCTTMCFTGKYRICHFFHFSFYIMILKHYPMEIILHSKTRIKFTDNCKDFFFLSSGDVPKSMLLWHDMSSSDQLLLYVFASWEIPRFFCFFQKWFFFFIHSVFRLKNCPVLPPGKTIRTFDLCCEHWRQMFAISIATECSLPRHL